jgi:hypothetical protein
MYVSISEILIQLDAINFKVDPLCHSLIVPTSGR